MTEHSRIKKILDFKIKRQYVTCNEIENLEKYLRETMDTRKAVDIINAINNLADFFNEDSQEFLNSLVILQRHRVEPLNEAIILYEEFRKADIVKRGELFGIKISVSNDGGYETEETILSEG